MHNRAATTLHGGRLLTSLAANDMTQNNTIRFKKVGNLMTVEKTYDGGSQRINTLNKGANANLFLKNLSNFS